MELITIPKSWIEDKIKKYSFENSDNKQYWNSRTYDILNELLENSKSAEDVFNAGQQCAIDRNFNHNKTTYQDYLNSLTK
jgi:hypothetical protein